MGACVVDPVSVRVGRQAPRSAAACLLVLAAALLLAGCRVGAEVVLDVGSDGRGSAEVVIDLDAEVVRELDLLGVDPVAELTAAATAAEAWQLGREAGTDGGLRLVLTHEQADLAVVTGALRELAAGLDERDPALLIDLEVRGGEDGGTQLAGSAGVRGPATAGAVRDGQVLGPSADELAALVGEVLDARLEVRLPGRLEVHDADEVGNGDALIWQLDTPREVSASARVMAWPWWWWAGGAAALVVLVAAVVGVARRFSRAG